MTRSAGRSRLLKFLSCSSVSCRNERAVSRGEAKARSQRSAYSDPRPVPAVLHLTTALGCLNNPSPIQLKLAPRVALYSTKLGRDGWDVQIQAESNLEIRGSSVAKEVVGSESEVVKRRKEGGVDTMVVQLSWGGGVRPTKERAEVVAKLDGMNLLDVKELLHEVDGWVALGSDEADGLLAVTLEHPSCAHPGGAGVFDVVGEVKEGVEGRGAGGESGFVVLVVEPARDPVRKAETKGGKSKLTSPTPAQTWLSTHAAR